MNDSDINLLTSQDLNFIMSETGDINDIVNGNIGLLEEEEISLPDQYNDVPSNEDYPGPFNFETFIDPQQTKNWMYSGTLNKVFITSHSNFAVDFKWAHPGDKINLFVRAMPLYSSPQDAHKPVIRCIQHAHATESSNKDFSGISRLHIMRCCNDQARYEGGCDRHLSVVVPLGQPQPGLDTVKHRYIFVCKNSCTTGMNRRPIEVVFTLEDEIGRVLGRSKVNVRVCSCPKRDKEKEERDYMKGKDGQPPKGKKRKIPMYKKSTSSILDASDIGIYNITANIVGKKNRIAVLKYAQNLMAAEIVRNKVEEPYRKCYNELETLLKNVDSNMQKTGNLKSSLKVFYKSFKQRSLKRSSY